MRAASKNWRKHEKKGNFLELVKRQKLLDARDSARDGLHSRGYYGRFNEYSTFKNISTDSTNIILVDKRKGDDLGGAGKGPYNRLTTAMLTHLASTLPSLALKHGKSAFSPFGESVTGLNTSVNTVQSGTPLILLDTRSRRTITDNDLKVMPNYAAFQQRREGRPEVEEGKKSVKTRSKTNKIAPAVGESESESTLEDSAGVEARSEIIEWAKRTMEDEQKERRAQGKMGNAEDVSDLAWFYDAFVKLRCILF